jgi:hypothetical protein
MVQQREIKQLTKRELKQLHKLLVRYRYRLIREQELLVVQMIDPLIRWVNYDAEEAE